MRMIGILTSKGDAERFSLVLHAKGINNEYEPSDGDSFVIWVHSEDHLRDAEALFNQFRQNPADPAFKQDAASGARQQRQEDISQRRAKRSAVFSKRRARVSAVGHVTLTIIVLCVMVFMLSDMGKKMVFLNNLLISTYIPLPGVHWWNSLLEIRSGQFWRLITPIFIHFNLLHILFNMLWLFDLGSMLERKKGSPFLILFIVAIAVPSNLAQYAFSGPMFGGMSGVVYGMLGYVWMKSRFAPEEKMYLHPSTVTMMLVWFALGFFGVIGSVANVVHATGLVIGVAWGYLSTLRIK